MAENYLITGYWGEPHVTSENDRGINAAIFGAGRFILPVGEQFRAEYIGNNTVRMYDGKLMNNGAAAGIPAGEYIDLLIPEAGQGMNRNDLIIFQYSQDRSTLIEKGVFIVLSGDETSGTATDPALSQQDILTNEATLDQMALWRVSVSGTVISAPVQLFEVSKNIKNAGISVAEATSSDGVAYSATVPGITELYAGLEVTIIPNVDSASTAITLNINGLGAKVVRLPVSTNTAMLAQPDTETYFVGSRPVKLMYDTKYAGKGSWVVVGKQIQSGDDIYGSVPIEHGGTGADNAEEARENLGAAPDGYGLGKDIDELPTANDANDCVKNGWYKLIIGTANGFGAQGIMRVDAEGGANIVQTAYAGYSTSRGMVIKQRVKHQGTWGEWEYVTPLCVSGEEYRTTERLDGVPVYCKVISFGTLPNSTFKNVAHGITGKVRNVRYEISTISTARMFANYPGITDIVVDGTNVKITTNQDMSDISVLFALWYTKG